MLTSPPLQNKWKDGIRKRNTIGDKGRSTNKNFIVKWWQDLETLFYKSKEVPPNNLDPLVVGNQGTNKDPQIKMPENSVRMENATQKNREDSRNIEMNPSDQVEKNLHSTSPDYFESPSKNTRDMKNCNFPQERIQALEILSISDMYEKPVKANCEGVLFFFSSWTNLHVPIYC